MDNQEIARLMGELQELQSYASQFASVIASAQDAAPELGVGRDQTGVARVEVDREGIPITLTVATDWSREVEAEQLATALVEAYGAARDNHMRAWDERMKANGWKYDVADLDQGRLPKPAQSPFEVPTISGPPPSLNRFVEDVFKELDRSHTMAQQPPPEPKAPAPAQSESGAVAVSIGGGALITLTIDPDWARSSSADVINGELATALRRARSLDGEARATPDPSADRNNQLLGEAFALLNQLRYERPGQ